MTTGTAKRRTAASLKAEAEFRARIEELGGTVLEPTWKGNHEPHRVRCAVGHEWSPRPHNVRNAKSTCRTCAGHDPKAAWDTFRARVAELGGTVLEPSWLSNNKPHRVRCAKGHDCSPRPIDVQQGRGICRTCAGQDPKAAWDTFRARVAELGGTVLEPSWLGTNTPHRVRCREGHQSSPEPNSVRKGQGICRVCAGQDHRTYYVVASDWMVKPGITTDDPRPRLANHRRSYRLADVQRLVTGLPEGFARDAERHVLDALAGQGVSPCYGNEYFRAEWLDLVIHEADEHLANELWALPAAHRGWQRAA